MRMSIQQPLVCSAAVLAITGFVSTSNAEGRIVASTLVWVPQGTFNGVEYRRYEAMFEGTASNGRPYRVPCQIIAPRISGSGSGLLLFDWLVPSTIPTAVRSVSGTPASIHHVISASLPDAAFILRRDARIFASPRSTTAGVIEVSVANATASTRLSLEPDPHR